MTSESDHTVHEWETMPWQGQEEEKEREKEKEEEEEEEK